MLTVKLKPILRKYVIGIQQISIICLFQLQELFAKEQIVGGIQNLEFRYSNCLKDILVFFVFPFTFYLRIYKQN